MTMLRIEQLHERDAALCLAGGGMRGVGSGGNSRRAVNLLIFFGFTSGVDGGSSARYLNDEAACEHKKTRADLRTAD